MDSSKISEKLPDALCAGLMVFRIVNEKIEYLMLKASDLKNHWTPPKGHLDDGETDFLAALRETQEESGLLPQDYDIVPGFTTHVQYEAGNTIKHVTYWPAKIKDSKTQVIISNEHVAFLWCELEELIEICNRESTTKAYKELEKFLKNKYNLNSKK